MANMNLDPLLCYRAVQARDARYDGLFFTCVRTTRIYCRPICPAHPPKFENCVFAPTAAAAQEAGFRPCLRCRPESSPDLGAWRGTSATVSRALSLIEEGALDGDDVEALAERLGIGERHLRRLFQQHLGASPITVAQTRRVLLAKQLIHDTDLPMTEVALASGFSSLRRFNETFQQLYRRPPSELRRRVAVKTPASDITLMLAYRPPYDWASMIRFLEARALPGLEFVQDGRYSRVVTLSDAVGSVEIAHAPEQSALKALIRFPRLDLLPAIILRIRRLFDLGADPGAIGAALSRDAHLAPLVAARPGLRLPGAWDAFEIAVRAMLGQQITVKAATRLGGKLVAALGAPIGESAVQGLTHGFPRPDQFDLQVVARLGMPRTRAEALAALATAAVAEPSLFHRRGDLDEAIAQLRRLPGVGEWTAQYIAMRALRESDAFLAGDVAVQRAFAVAGRRPKPRELLARAEAWRPWRAYAVLHLWMAEPAPELAAIKENANALAA
jgi:AraC family transcriptional regulator, regulatory protein of adaptative response / DNA-3-methyladenine glycosylase II